MPITLCIAPVTASPPPNTATAQISTTMRHRTTASCCPILAAPSSLVSTCPNLASAARSTCSSLTTPSRSQVCQCRRRSCLCWENNGLCHHLPLFGGTLRELLVVEPRVETILGQQFFVCTALDNLSLIDHQGEIGGEDGREAVRDGQRGAALHEWLQGGLNQALGVGIQRAGGLVQNEDTRIFKDHTRDGDALLLTTGELIAALTNDGIVAF